MTPVHALPVSIGVTEGVPPPHPPPPYPHEGRETIIVLVVLPVFPAASTY